MYQHTQEITATAELVYQVASSLISVIVPAIGYYLIKMFKQSAFASKYNLDNERVERTLENAVMYAEAAAKRYASNNISKRQLANRYIDIIDKDIMTKYGDKLELMLDRKVKQVIKK